MALPGLPWFVKLQQGRWASPGHVARLSKFKLQGRFRFDSYNLCHETLNRELFMKRYLTAASKKSKSGCHAVTRTQVLFLW